MRVVPQGNVVWRRLEERRVCGGARTWQSMKEQFRKVSGGNGHKLGRSIF